MTRHCSRGGTRDQRASRQSDRILLGFSACAAIALLLSGGPTGCSSGGSGAPDADSLESIRIDGSRAGARGTTRHLDAAVRFAASQQSIAVVQVVDIDESTRVYELLTIRDEQGWVRIDGLDGSGEVRGLDLAAQIGRMGDPARESMLVGAIRDRLATKAGGDWSGE